MTFRKARRASWLVALATMAVAGSAQAGMPEGSNLLGQHGLLRLSAATPLSAGWLSLSTDFQFYKVSGLLVSNSDHQRMVNTYTINWAPFRFLEAAFAMHVTSDSSSLNTSGATPTEELQVAVGDPEIVLKGGYELGKGFGLGGLLDVRFPSAAGFFQASGSATNVFFAVLGSWSGGNSLPLGIHLNVGFQRDGSSNLFDAPGKLSASQRFAAQVSSFNRVVTRFGMEYITSYVGPFLELSLEPFVGDGAPGFSKSPGTLSFGARVWPTKAKGLQLLAAVDVGIIGVGDGTDTVNNPANCGLTNTCKYAFVIPRWNLLLSLAYRFEPFAKPEKVVVGGGGGGGGEIPPPPPKPGIIVGSVVDERTDKPIWNARVSLEGEQASSLAVNPSDGGFRSYKLDPGKHTVVASADGYGTAKLEVQVPPDGEGQARVKLAARTTVTPGTLRGAVKALTGKLAGATVLIPEIDQTISVESDGSFTVSLKPGEYKVVVSAKGFRTQTKTIRILEGSTVILNVDLYK
jgi:hypothetical protein